MALIDFHVQHSDLQEEHLTYFRYSNKYMKIQAESIHLDTEIPPTKQGKN